MWNFRLNYLSQSLLYFPLSLDLGFLHVIRALKLSRAILNHSFSIFCRNSHNNPLSSQNLTFLPNWSHWSVSDLKIGKTQLLDHLLCCHAPPHVTQTFRISSTLRHIPCHRSATSSHRFKCAPPPINRSMADILNAAKIDINRGGTRPHARVENSGGRPTCLPSSHAHYSPSTSQNPPRQPYPTPGAPKPDPRPVTHSIGFVQWVKKKSISNFNIWKLKKKKNSKGENW